MVTENNELKTCSRCGCEIPILDVIYNSVILKILNEPNVLWFCNCCKCIIHEKEDVK